MGWQAWAEPVLGAPYVWCASFSASVPHGRVAAFASLLASPVPVPRSTVPKTAEGRLTVVHRTEAPAPGGAASGRLVANPRAEAHSAYPPAASVVPQRRPTGWAAVGVRPVSCLRARRGIRSRFVRRRS
ncbi:DUF317 domain-containing protein [Streptomyces sp. NPDC054770]